MLHKEHQMYDQADKDADEWRAREIAKDIARRKVDKMKTVAKAAKEERQMLESELELVEKLQELRSIRIQKLKKQGHFLPEEDDKFLEKVRLAVEEEECIQAAAADTHAAKDAIATAEEFQKVIQINESEMRSDTGCRIFNLEQSSGAKNGSVDSSVEPECEGIEGQDCSRSYDSVGTLPVEFYHYYHGSNTDMGTLIEVRRQRIHSTKWKPNCWALGTSTSSCR